MSKDESSAKVYGVPFEVTGKGTVYVLADSADDAQNFVDELSAGDLLDLELDFDVESSNPTEEDGEEWDFAATLSGEADEDDEDDEDDEEEEDE